MIGVLFETLRLYSVLQDKLRYSSSSLGSCFFCTVCMKLSQAAQHLLQLTLHCGLGLFFFFSKVHHSQR